MRLYETGPSSLFASNVNASEDGRNFAAKESHDVFNKIKSVAHVKFSKKRDSFSICTVCLNFKTMLSNPHATVRQRNCNGPLTYDWWREKGLRTQTGAFKCE
jgi:hypothetical protein